MIGKEIFVEQMKKLQIAFGEDMHTERAKIYYDKLNNDIPSDECLISIVDKIIENEFKFPPVAAVFGVDRVSVDQLHGILPQNGHLSNSAS